MEVIAATTEAYPKDMNPNDDERSFRTVKINVETVGDLQRHLQRALDNIKKNTDDEVALLGGKVKAQREISLIRTAINTGLKKAGLEEMHLPQHKGRAH